MTVPRKRQGLVVERELTNSHLSHGGCQVNGPKVAKFLDR